MSDDSAQHRRDEESTFKVTHTITLKVTYACTIIFLGLIFLDPNKFLDNENQLKGSIAIVVKKSNDVKVKHPKGATWSTLKKGDKLYPNTMVFTATGSSVMMLLEDESVIEQGPDSLLRLKIVKKYISSNTSKEDVKSDIDLLNSLDKKLVDEGPFEESDGLDLEIDGGNISVSTSGKSKIKSIKTRDSILTLGEDSEVEINNEGSSDTKYYMKSGNAVLSTGPGKQASIALKENESISTKKIRERNSENPQDAIEKKKRNFNMSTFFGEKYTAKKKSIWNTIKKMVQVILFLD
ncbi:MAG: hypothetical protein HN576_03880 [Bacteriovoracaceae bacterium]|jgi:hypothetical protein|nr:hypothetical protein [Bacteriovoracaceae bacterium]